MGGWKASIIIKDTSKMFDNDGKLIFYDWLKEQFGDRDLSKSAGTWRWTIIGNNPIVVYFRHKADAMLFKLTWL